MSALNTHRPQASIGMPVYNGEPFLEEALDSILAQTFSDFELIISDNASMDQTEKICRKYAAKDKRIRYFRNHRNVGAAKNFNQVFWLSRGEYFKWAAVDDVLEPEFLAKCVELLDRDPTTILAYPRLKVIDDYYGTGLREGTLPYERVNLQSSLTRERFRQMLFIVLPSVYPIFGLIRASVLKRTPLIRPCIGGDHCLLVDLALQGKFGEVPYYLMRGRWHANSYGGTLSRIIRNGGREGTAQAEWYDPENKNRIVLPYWRRLWEYFLSLMHSDERLGEKILMVVFLCVAAVGYREKLKAELGDAVRQALYNKRMSAAGNCMAGIVETAFIVPMIALVTVCRTFGWKKRLLRLLHPATPKSSN